MLKKYFIRGAHRRIIGSVTTGYSDSSGIVRDQRTKLPGAPTRVSTPCVMHMET